MTRTATIRPLLIDIPQTALDDLADRLGKTRWPQEIPELGWSRGVPLAYLRELADYWRDGFDWRAQEAKLNAFPQYTTDIDGQSMHFLHIRSPEPGAVPLLLVHGWPGSVVEFAGLVGPLTDPVRHGGDPADAFHIVVPSIPGFGFSGPTTEPGWSPRRIAAAFAELMARLGYDYYGAQGGDVGAGICRELGLIDSEHMIGLHVNGGLSYPQLSDEEIAALTETEQARITRMNEFMQEAGGYLAIQSTRPQTLAYALTDSPIGQLAWIVDKYNDFTNLDQLPHEAVGRDMLLTQASIYWFTQTAGSSAAAYYEDAHSGAGWGLPEPATVPTAVAQFTIQDVAIRGYDERSNNIVSWTEYDRGGHFAAMEAPDLLLDDVRAFFRNYRPRD
ncbi:alpha/beta fold hydrolase [Nocardia uniformis]|uniref:Alpha/beta fold hydrolase n=1 Tax=Nocardia uniformis TaxID=53432 RepID=A0A849CA57_9NOCA|nr:epoxide hydrolase family protein [Nocardia uniformis]NNH72817.1 alpha/beta fold hydrolase [Nocardia uniformis]